MAVKASTLREYFDEHGGTIIGVSFFILLGAFLSLQFVPLETEAVRGKVVNMTEPADALPLLYLELASGRVVISAIPKEVPVRYGQFVELNKHRTLFGRDRYQFVRYVDIGR